MKERQIIMQAESVRAILDGRKTQTRRVVKPPDDASTGSVYEICDFEDDNGADAFGAIGTNDSRSNYGIPFKCPHGQPGDRLWVRESIECVVKDGEWASTCYSADGQPTVADAWPWKTNHLSPMFMPYGLSRITLELVNVRVERVQDISEADAKAEGIKPVSFGVHDKGFEWSPVEDATYTARESYKHLWNSIHGKNPARCWDANPWAWVLEFKRVKP